MTNAVQKVTVKYSNTKRSEVRGKLEWCAFPAHSE